MKLVIELPADWIDRATSALVDNGTDDERRERLAEVVEAAMNAWSEENLSGQDAFPTLAQAISLRRQLSNTLRMTESQPFGSWATVSRASDLPEGYLFVREGRDGFECGIALDGAVSS